LHHLTLCFEKLTLIRYTSVSRTKEPLFTRSAPLVLFTLVNMLVYVYPLFLSLSLSLVPFSHVLPAHLLCFSSSVISLVIFVLSSFPFLSLSFIILY